MAINACFGLYADTESQKPGSFRVTLTLAAGKRGDSSNPSQQRSAESPQRDTRKDQKRQEAEQRQARYKVRKTQQELVGRLEGEIQELEARQRELVAELEMAETYEQPGRPVAVNRELMDVQQRLGELNPRWEQEATRLAALD